MNHHRKMLSDIRDELAEDRTRDLEAEARRFLAALDPDSSEGMWFDAVAASFPSRLEAAIAYVAAMA
jgi:hypothetical protein